MNGFEAPHIEYFTVSPILIVLGVAGQARRHLVERRLGQQRHAVKALLAMDRDVVAQCLKSLAREGLIHAFDLLQADNVGGPLLEPGLQAVQQLADRINVPSRYSHKVAIRMGYELPPGRITSVLACLPDARRDMHAVPFIC